jgi:geranylgeranylglycerol-phosphate geranylgeranyltransferase
MEHSAMLVIAVLAAEMIAGRLPGAWILILSIVSPVFISMSSFAVNDYFDLEVDRMNNRKRPLVTGDMKPSDAVYITILSMLIGLVASALINWEVFVIALVFGILALLYSYKLKEIAFVGNSYIAFSMAIPFIYGSYVVSSELGNGIILIFCMIFLSGLAREIHGTIRDIEGDSKARKIRSLPGIIGTMASAAIALLLYIIAIAISAYIFFRVAPFKMNLVYALPITITDIMLAYTGIGFLVKSDRRFYDLARNLSLVAMGLALIAILLAPI